MDIEKLKVELEEYGFVIIHNLIPTDQAVHMTDRLIEIMRQQPDKDMPNQNLRGVFNYNDQDTFIPLVTHPVYLELAAHMLGPGFQMAEVGARWIKPGAEAQNLHADVPIGWFPQSGLVILVSPDGKLAALRTNRLVSPIWASDTGRLLSCQLYLDVDRFYARKRCHTGDAFQPSFPPNPTIWSELQPSSNRRRSRGFHCYLSWSYLASRGSQHHYRQASHRCV